MHILADATMPLVTELTEHLAQLLAPHGQQVQLTTFVGRQPTAAQLADAEFMLIRSITRVDSDQRANSHHAFQCILLTYYFCVFLFHHLLWFSSFYHSLVS